VIKDYLFLRSALQEQQRDSELPGTRPKLRHHQSPE
jgi:hypothetical protein